MNSCSTATAWSSNESGEVIARGKQFEEDLIVVDLDVESVFRQRLRDPRRRQQSVAESAPVAEFPLARHGPEPCALELHDVQAAGGRR